MSTATDVTGGAVVDPPLPKLRGVWFVVVMSLFTFGIYEIYWLYSTFKEVKEYRRAGIGGLLGVVATIFIVGVFLLPSYVGRMVRDAGRDRYIGAWTGLWVLVPYIGGVIWLVRVQTALNDFIAAQGAEPAARISEHQVVSPETTPAAYLRAELKRVGVAPPSPEAVRLGFRPSPDGSSIAVLRGASGKEWTGSLTGATSRLSNVADGAGPAEFWRVFDKS